MFWRWAPQRELQDAAASGDDAKVRRILKNDQVNICDWAFISALHLAARNGRDSVVEVFLADARVDVNCAYILDQTALHLAAENGHDAVVKVLLADARTDVNKTNWWWRTPLYVAARNGHDAVVRLLLANDRVDVHEKDRDGTTPLLAAVAGEHESIAIQLLESVVQMGFSGSVATALLESANLKIQRRMGVLLLKMITAAQITGKVSLGLLAESLSRLGLLSPPWIVQHIFRLLIFLARRLQTTLRRDPTLDRRSEFPNRRRPPCTTMPWNIWPVLVVLWDVCWMFYTPPATPRPDESQANLWYSGDSSYDSTHDLHWDLPEGNLDDYQRTFGLEALPMPAPSSSWMDLLPQGANDFVPARATQTWAFTMTESPQQTTMPSILPATEVTTNESGHRIASLRHVNPNDLLHPSMALESPRPTQPSPSTNLPTMVTQSWSSPIAKISQSSATQPSTNSDKAMPPRDAAGNMICNRDGCGGTTFPRRCDWKKHMDKHDRPYKCLAEPCTNTSGFATKGELKRHNESKHADQGYYCTHPGCSRSPWSNNPFKRKDNLKQHMKLMHDTLMDQTPTHVQAGSTSLVQHQHAAAYGLNAHTPTNFEDASSPFPVSQYASTPSRSGPRNLTRQLHWDEPEPSTRKRRRLDDTSPPSGPEHPKSTGKAPQYLENENERLRKQVFDLTQELEASRSREAASRAREAKLADLVSHYARQRD